jgi:DNA-binding CsgD family transcriptional regulator
VSGSPRTVAVQEVLRACRAAEGDLGAFRIRFLAALGRAVPFDAAFMAEADPDTLLFTGVRVDEPLAAAGALFLDNEFGAAADVNRFADLAHAPDPVASLDEVTGGDRAASPRWRDIIAPLGMGDELRVALRVDGTVWGFLCLHRSGPTGFTAADKAALRCIAPHAGEAIRRTVASMAMPSGPTEVPQAVILIADGVVSAIAGAIDDLDEPVNVGDPLPVSMAAVVRRFEAVEASIGGSTASLPTALRMTTHTGALVMVHPARLHNADGVGPIVLTVTPAASMQRSSLLLAAHGLTPAQRRVANLVLQGRTTRQIMVDLAISAHTVQDHLKAVFEKVGVRSRRDLVASLMSR